jgi:hypothetical protein
MASDDPPDAHVPTTVSRPRTSRLRFLERFLQFLAWIVFLCLLLLLVGANGKSISLLFYAVTLVAFLFYLICPLQVARRVFLALAACTCASMFSPVDCAVRPSRSLRVVCLPVVYAASSWEAVRAREANGEQEDRDFVVSSHIPTSNKARRAVVLFIPMKDGKRDK